MLILPTISPLVTQPFGVNPHVYRRFGLPGHNGVDFFSPLGAPYFWPFQESGRVVWVSNRKHNGLLSSYGWHIKIETDSHLVVFAHAQPVPPVAVGDIVKLGQTVGFSGNTGFSTGPHLHFEMRRLDGRGLDGWPWGIVDPTPHLAPLLALFHKLH